MITLKEHNIKPYKELCRMLETEDKVAYVSATGTGKSYVVGKYIEENVPYEKVLILAPTREIKRNWNKLLPGVKTFTYTALLSSPLILEEVEVLVCDEMHHLGANDTFSALRSKKSANPLKFQRVCKVANSYS